MCFLYRAITLARRCLAARARELHTAIVAYLAALRLLSASIKLWTLSASLTCWAARVCPWVILVANGGSARISRGRGSASGAFFIIEPPRKGSS